jgi:hypothetical protein
MIAQLDVSGLAAPPRRRPIAGTWSLGTRILLSLGERLFVGPQPGVRYRPSSPINLLATGKERQTMTVLDDLAAERQRLTERLARVDAEQQKLADQIAELDAAERVLSRITATPAVNSRRGRRARSAVATPSTAAPARRTRAARGGRKQPAKPQLRLGDASLRALEALGSEASAEQIREHLSSEFGIQVRPNHLGMALQRHRRAGRLEQRDGRWSMAQTASAGNGS